MIRSVDNIDRQEAIEQARAAAQVAREAQAAPAETSTPTLAQQAQAAATEAADLSSASNQLSQQWSAIVSNDEHPASPKSETHEIKPTATTPASTVPSDAYEGVSATDKASLTDGTFTNAQAQYQAYMQGAVHQVQVELENGSRTEDVALEGAELASYQANFRADNGMTLDQISRLQGVQATVAQNQAILDELGRQQKAATTFAEATYGLNERDKQLLADPKTVEAQARYAATASSFSKGLASWEREQSGLDGGGGYDPTALQNFQENFMDKTVVSASGDRDEYVISNPRYRDLASFTAGYIDPQTGLTGKELAHISQAQAEQIQGDAAMKKLAAVNVGSFTRDPKAEATPASQAFTVIGKDQMDALLAKGNSSLGKGFVLEETGQLILPDEHETGVYFLSNPTVTQLRARGVIDEANGGLNIDGLYLDGGNAAIGTSRPSGGLFGSLLNGLSHILPGGAVGRMLADAVSDTTEFVNRPVLQTAAALGDEHGLMAQAADLAAVTVDVSAHANETGNATFAELARRSADDAGALQLANTIGSAMISTGVLAGVGAALVVSSSAVLAGQAQLRGQEADANAGIWQAATAYAASALMGGTGEGQGISAAELGSGGTSTAASATVTTAGNGGLNSLIAQNFGAASPFISGAASNLAGQFMNGQDLNLRQAAVAGALGYIGANTQIGSTGVNGVQVVQLGQALASGDANQIASNLFSMGASAMRSTNPNLNGAADPEAKNPEASAAPSPADSEPAAPGPQSSGGAEEPEPQTRPAAQRTPDAMDRARLSEGSLASSGPNGSTVITRPDGTVTTISAGGAVRESRPDGSTANLLPNGTVVENRPGSNVPSIQSENFGQASAAARAANLGVFEWRGNLYNTGRDDQLTAAAIARVGGNPELSTADVTEVREALNRAQARYAMGIANNPGRANLSGFDAAAQDNEVGRVVVAAQQRNAEMRSQIAARFEALGASLGGQVPAAAPAATSTPVDDNSFLGALTTRAGNVLAHLEQGRQALVDVTSRGMQYVADNSAGQMALDYLTYQMRGGQAIVNAAADAGGRALDAGGRALDYLSRSSAGQIAQDFNQAVVQPVVSSGTNGGRSVVDYLSNTSGSQMVSDYVDLYGRVVQGGVHAAEVVGDTVLPIRSLYNTVERMGDAPPRPGEGVRNSIELAANLVGVVTAPLGLGAGGAAREATEVVAASTAREAAAAGGREAAGAAAGAVSREATEVAAQRTIAEGAGLGMSEAGAAERSAATLVERPAASAGSAGERSATGLTSGEGAQAGAGQPVHSLEIPPAQQPGVTNLSEWQTTGEGRWRTYTDSEGVLWKEQETKGISSRLRLGGFDGLSEEARAVGSQELRPMVHPNGANISFEVAGLPKGDARVGFVQEALDHMAPEARLYAQRVFASERIGQSLDELGRVIPGSEVAGLAGGSRGPQMIIDRARLTSVESAQQMIYHEAGHNFELALARTPEYGGQLPSSRGFWGDGNVVHERALANAAEDFAETHRVVVQNWNEYIGRSAADWASETGTLAEKKLEILRGYGVKVPTQAELEAARALRPATPDILI